MSIRPFVWLAALLAVMGLAGTAQAQKCDPFIEPGYFGQPDFQFFAPAEVGDFGGEEPPNTGIYFDYDRLYVDVNRPDGEASRGSEFQGDFTWGNRWEIGFMTEEHTGWQAIVYHLSGPNEYSQFFQERLDGFNEDDVPPDSQAPIIADRNPRIFDVRTSLNVASFSSLELNKTWRRKQFHNGAVLEPLVGFRYMVFKNWVRRDDYDRFAADAAGNPDPFTFSIEGPYELFTQDVHVYENYMIGGQLGARLFRQTGHWLISADIRMFAVQNFQTLNRQQLSYLTRYDPPLNGDVELNQFDRVDTFREAQEFVWGGEVRAEASYELTRDINLRFGMVFIDLGQGIGRSRDIHDNDEDVQIAGLTFGFTINR